MDSLEQLVAFCQCAGRDARLQPVHVSLYTALLVLWRCHRFVCPFPVCRETLMQQARISSRVTYHKRLRELHRFGYIVYHPAYDYYKGSTVQLCALPGNSRVPAAEIPNLFPK